MDCGVKVTLATDGVTMTDTTLSTEYHLAHTLCGLTATQLLQCIHNGFNSAFVEDHEQMAKDAVEKASKMIERQ